MDCSDWECRHWKVLLSSSRWKSTWHPKHVRSCGEAGDFNDVTLAWKDGLLLTLKSESVDDFKQPVFWKWRTSRRCQRLAANPENGVWWRQICWKMICFRAEAWMCHNHCGRKYSGFRAYAAKLLKLMPCDYTGNSVLGVVWSVATPSGNSFTYLHFIGSFYTVCFMSINCTLSWNKWPLYPQLQLSHRNHPQKNFRFRARGHFLGLTPVFGRFWPLTH